MTESRICKHCMGLITLKSTKAIYCSISCKNKANHILNKSRLGFRKTIFASADNVSYSNTSWAINQSVDIGTENSSNCVESSPSINASEPSGNSEHQVTKPISYHITDLIRQAWL